MGTLTLEQAMQASITAAAARSGRSQSDQIAHWLMNGRAIDESAGFDFSKVEAALSGKRDTKDLTETERMVWNACIQDLLARPDQGEDDFYARRRARGLGVGLDADGRIARLAEGGGDDE